MSKPFQIKCTKQNSSSSKSFKNMMIKYFVLTKLFDFLGVNNYNVPSAVIIIIKVKHPKH